jgi:hypothetical protein
MIKMLQKILPFPETMKGQGKGTGKNEYQAYAH